MRIEVENLSEAGEPFAHTYAPGGLELDSEAVGLSREARVEGRASRRGEEIRVRGKIETGVEVACDRCLAPVAVPLEVEFDTAFIPQERAAAAEENVELHAEDMGLAAFEGDAIDLDELVREQILLALPARHLCREECKGLCPTCGADLNAGRCGCEHKEADPRWAALADLKKNKDRES
ncbi:MAG TPA: DUF177 domain-containing protein [Pyrinomonadaceae bacterium]|nr:DUF177 domain-containing protein [Pyrinomonadaceae bacterium]